MGHRGLQPRCILGDEKQGACLSTLPPFISPLLPLYSLPLFFPFFLPSFLVPPLLPSSLPSYSLLLLLLVGVCVCGHTCVYMCIHVHVEAESHVRGLPLIIIHLIF